MPAELWILAGPNGSGKTTLARQVAEALPDDGNVLWTVGQVLFLNPDAVTLGRLRRAGFGGFADAPGEVLRETFLASARDVEAAIDALVNVDGRIGVETVLSTEKYRTHVEAVLARGGAVRMIYVIVNDPAINVERVRQRVAAGGHDVPTEKIHERWGKSLKNMPWFASRCENFWVFDNSSSDPDLPPVLVAFGSRGVVVERQPTFQELEIALSAIRPPESPTESRVASV